MKRLSLIVITGLFILFLLPFNVCSQTGEAKIVSKRAHVYIEPDVTSKRVTTLKRNDRLTVDESHLGWFKVTVKGKTGWIEKKHVEITKVETLEIPEVRMESEFVEIEPQTEENPNNAILSFAHEGDSLGKKVKKFTTPQFGLQLATDFSFLQFPGPATEFNPGRLDPDVDYLVDDIKGVGTSEYFGKKIGFGDMFWIRMDMWTKASVSERTNIYGLVSFRALDRESGSQDDFSYTVLNAEIEHYFNKSLRFRLGRLVNKWSRSRMFGRITLGESDAHVFGRTPFINDAFQMDWNMMELGIPVSISSGLKCDYAPFDYHEWFFAPHLKIGSATDYLKMYAIYTFTKQQEDEVKVYLPGYEGERYYHGFEAELAYNFDGGALVPFVNFGALSNYIGYIPHYSGPRDMARGNVPVVYDPDNSLSETMTTCAGLTIRPWKFIQSWDFFKEITLEGEIVGMGRDDVTQTNLYGHVKFNVLDIFIDYGLYYNNIVYDEMHTFKNSSGAVVISADELNCITHYLRFSTTLRNLAKAL